MENQISWAVWNKAFSHRYSEGLAIPGNPVVAAWEWGKRPGKRTDYFNDEILHINPPESQIYFARLAECGISRLYLHDDEFLASGTTRRTDLRVMGPQYVAEIGKQRQLVDDYKKMYSI